MKELILFISLFTFCQLGIGQIGGRHVYQVLDFSPSARISALGGNLIAVNDGDLTVALQNPATLSKKAHNVLSFNHNFHLGDIKSGYFGYGRHLKKMETMIHGGVQFATYGNFEAYDEFETSLGSFKASEYVISLGAARQLYENLRLGVNLKLINSRLETYELLGLAFDVGAYYQIPGKNFSAALVFKDMGTQLSPYVPGNKEPLPFEIQLGIAQRLKHLPFRFSIIATNLQRWNIRYDDPNTEEADFLFGNIEDTGESDFSIFADNFFRHFIFNGEFLFGKNETLRVRIGYNHLRRQELSVKNFRSLAGFSMGMGLHFKRFSFDFGHSVFHLAGGLTHLGFTTHLSSF